LIFILLIFFLVKNSKIGSKFDGFKRASISEPAPERRFQRRGWLTFTSQINIKDTCAKINGTKVFTLIF